MTYEKSVEEKLYLTEKKLKELKIYSDKIDSEFNEIIKKWGFTPNELKKYAENPENYSEEEWEEHKKESEHFFNLIKEELEKITDTRKTESHRSSIGAIRSHWIPVR